MYQPVPKLAYRVISSTSHGKEGILYMFESAVTNFTGFAPLGTVLVTMLGIGIAERTWLISTALKALVTSVPKQFLTAALVEHLNELLLYDCFGHTFNHCWYARYRKNC